MQVNTVLLHEKMAELRVKPLDVAYNAEIHVNTLMNILNGRTKKAHPLTVRAIAKFLKFSEDQFYTGPAKRAG